MKKLDAYRVYLITQGSQSLIFRMIFTVDLVYQIIVVGLDPLQLVLVGTTLEITILLFELPTGIVADIYSRRLSVIIGTALMGVSFMIEGSFPVFAVILLSQVIWGIGITFISGALDAWISDEIGVDRAGRAYLRGAQVGQFAALFGIALSVALGSIVLQAPVVIGGALFVALAVFLLLVMPEEGFAPIPVEERRSWQQIRGQMGGTARDALRLLRLRPALLGIMAISLIYGAYSEGFDRLWQAQLIEAFTLPALGQMAFVVWFGIIGAVSMLLSIGVTEVALRRLVLTNARVVTRALSVLFGAIILGSIGFALARSFPLALGFYWLAATCRDAVEPIYTAWLNQHLESSVRATMLSAAGQADAIGQIAGGPLIG